MRAERAGSGYVHRMTRLSRLHGCPGGKYVYQTRPRGKRAIWRFVSPGQELECQLGSELHSAHGSEGFTLYTLRLGI